MEEESICSSGEPSGQQVLGLVRSAARKLENPDPGLLPWGTVTHASARLAREPGL